jgi:hypothetical protein
MSLFVAFFHQTNIYRRKQERLIISMIDGSKVKMDLILLQQGKKPVLPIREIRNVVVMSLELFKNLYFIAPPFPVLPNKTNKYIQYNQDESVQVLTLRRPNFPMSGTKTVSNFPALYASRFQ